MSVGCGNAAESREEMRAELHDLLLSRKIWTQAVERLAREKQRLLAVVDTSQPELWSHVWIRLGQIEHETALYEICIDRAQERAEQCQGIVNEGAARKRERFYRLVRGLAKAGNECADAGHRDPYIGCRDGEEGWSPNRWVSEMESIVSEARKHLVMETVT